MTQKTYPRFDKGIGFLRQRTNKVYTSELHLPLRKAWKEIDSQHSTKEKVSHNITFSEKKFPPFPLPSFQKLKPAFQSMHIKLSLFHVILIKITSTREIQSTFSFQNQNGYLEIKQRQELMQPRDKSGRFSQQRQSLDWLKRSKLPSKMAQVNWIELNAWLPWDSHGGIMKPKRMREQKPARASRKPSGDPSSD